MNKTIRSVCSRFSSGDGIRASEIHEDGNYPVFGGNGLRGYTNKYNFDGRCAIIGRQGAQCGNVRYFEGKAFMTEHAIVSVANEENDSGYLAYKYMLMNLNKYQGQSAQPGLSVNTLLDVPLDVPDIKTQRRVFNYLHLIDTKIANNNKISTALEGLAKTIYDYWFLQFEFPNEEGKPYKSSGGKMVYNEELKREIPEGWEVKNVSDLSDITWGQCPAGDNILPMNTELESIDYCSGAGDMHGGFLVDCQAKTNDSKRSAKDNDILVSVAGAIGNMCVVDHDISLGRAAMAYSSKKEEYLMYLYQSLKSLNKKITTVSSGSIQKVINSNNVKDFNIPFNYDVVKKYAEICNAMFYKMKSLSKENKKLASLRDWLLPMLMNGQVTIKS